MDIYHGYIRKNASQTRLVNVGKLTAAVALLIAIPTAIMLQNLDQAFQFIQEFTGFVSPGALAIFLLGFFWKKATSNGALLAAIGTFVFSAAFRYFMPELPFMDRMGIAFLLCILLMVLSALIERKPISEKGIKIDKMQFNTAAGFKIASLFIIIVLTVSTSCGGKNINMIDKINKIFHNKYGKSGVMYAAPGRVNLIGEHTDYNNGFVLPVQLIKLSLWKYYLMGPIVLMFLLQI